MEEGGGRGVRSVSKPNRVVSTSHSRADWYPAYSPLTPSSLRMFARACAVLLCMPACSCCLTTSKGFRRVHTAHSPTVLAMPGAKAWRVDSPGRVHSTNTLS